MSKSSPAPDGVADGGEASLFVENVSSDQISVLVVDDDPDVADLTKTYLENEEGEFDVTTKQSAREALSLLDDDAVDAIVSDYDMPRMNGLEFLAEVRDEYPNIPFILFTGKGSEEIASEAISEGVSDYLQKNIGASEYSVLANRLTNYVHQYKATKALEESERKFCKLVENSTDVISIVSENARFEYLSPAAEPILGYEPEELVGDCVFEYAHPDDRQGVMEEFFDAVENPEREPVVQFRFKDPDRTWPVLEARGRNLLDDDTVGGFLVNSRDITERKEREKRLERQNERLENMRKTLTHDIRNPLGVAIHSLQFYREDGDPDELDKLDRSLDRIAQLIDKIDILADQETTVGETETVDLEDVILDAWEMVRTGDAKIQIENSKHLNANETRLQQLFENLFRNAIDHGPDDVVVTVGAEDDTLYVADDGPGIPEEDREQVFESGFSTDPDSPGFGLTIVEQIARGHGWEIEVVGSEEGGARFDITNVQFEVAVYD